MIRPALLAVILALPACGGGAGEETNNQAGPDVPAGVAEVAEDPELANEAAADEAADIENFGGNAAAMDANAQ